MQLSVVFKELNCAQSFFRNKAELGCGLHGRAQGSNNFRRKNFSADMAPIDERGHVYARGRLDTLLSVCVCEVVTSRQPLS
jgi:hypothetical protein